MSEEKLEQEFLAIEEEIKEICSEFKGIFHEHGLAEGEQNNFWFGIKGNLDLYEMQRYDIKTLLGRWSGAYNARAKKFQKDKYVRRIKELTYKIYPEDEKAEHIVKRLESLPSEKKRRIKKKIKSIKRRCNKLIKVAKSLQQLVIDLINHSNDLDKKLESETNLEKLKDEEYKYAEGIRERMIEIGKKGWEIVCRIYSEAEETKQPLFKEIRTHFLT